jgi:uncharacterized protein (TIGR03437 family)
VGVFGLLAGAGSGVTVSSVNSAAGPALSAIAPGEIVSIYGTGLGPAAGVSFSVDASTGMVDSTLAGVRVLFGGVAAPILYASSTQINAIVPYEIAGQLQATTQEATMQVVYQSNMSPTMTLPVSGAAPGVFTLDKSGSGQAAALNQDGSVNGPSNPAARGSYMSIYFTGGGQSSPAGVTGSVNGQTLKYLVQQPSVIVGGQAVAVTFAGAAPDYVDGLNQLNIRLSGNTPSGAQSITILDGAVNSSAAVTVFIQ